MIGRGGWSDSSRATAAAWERGRLDEPLLVAEDVWLMASPIPEGSLPYTLSYLLVGGDGSVTVIDPGWDSSENFQVVESALAFIGREVSQISTVIATHHHPDHLGLADRLRSASGSQVMFTAAERAVLALQTSEQANDRARHAEQLELWGVPAQHHPDLLATFDRPSLVRDMDPDVTLVDDSRIEVSGHSLRVISTPGHTSGHLCLVDDERGVLYTGDHVLPRIFSGIGIGTLPGTEPLGDFLDSLDRIAEFDHLHVLPGHEFVFDGLGARRAELRAHHLRRTMETVSLEERLGDSSIWEYASRLRWTAGWDGLHGFMLNSALRQTEMHIALVRSGRAWALLERAALKGSI